MPEPTTIHLDPPRRRGPFLLHEELRFTHHPRPLFRGFRVVPAFDPRERIVHIEPCPLSAAWHGVDDGGIRWDCYPPFLCASAPAPRGVALADVLADERAVDDTVKHALRALAASVAHVAAIDDLIVTFDGAVALRHVDVTALRRGRRVGPARAVAEANAWLAPDIDLSRALARAFPAPREAARAEVDACTDLARRLAPRARGGPAVAAAAALADARWVRVTDAVLVSAAAWQHVLRDCGTGVVPVLLRGGDGAGDGWIDAVARVAHVGDVPLDAASAWTAPDGGAYFVEAEVDGTPCFGVRGRGRRRGARARVIVARRRHRGASFADLAGIAPRLAPAERQALAAVVAQALAAAATVRERFDLDDVVVSHDGVAAADGFDREDGAWRAGALSAADLRAAVCDALEVASLPVDREVAPARLADRAAVRLALTRELALRARANHAMAASLALVATDVYERQRRAALTLVKTPSARQESPTSWRHLLDDARAAEAFLGDKEERSARRREDYLATVAAFIGIGRTEDAFTLCGIGVRRIGVDAYALMLLAYLHAERGDAAAAADVLRSVDRTDPVVTGELDALCAVLAEKSGAFRALLDGAANAQQQQR